MLRDSIPLPHHRRRIHPIPLQRGHHGPEPRRVSTIKFTHTPMISRDTRPLRPIQHRRCAALVHDVILCVFQIRPFLLPEEKHAEARHEWYELVGNLLQHFGVFLEGAQEGGVRFEGLSGQGHGGEFLKAAEQVGFAGAEVRGAEKEDAVGAGVDGVVVGDFGGGAGVGVGEGSFDDDAA